MTLWGVASGPGAPGATTVTLALTKAFPPVQGRPRLAIEGNPAGGVLAARFDHTLRLDVDLSKLTVALKHRWDADAALSSARELWSGVHVVVAPPSAPRVRAALAVRPDQVAASLAAADADVIVDMGRLDVLSPVLPWARRAVEVVFVGRSRVEDSLLIRAQIEELAAAGVTTSLLLVKENDRSGRNPAPDEVADMIGVPLLGVLPSDGESAGVFSGGSGGGRRLEKSDWWATVKTAASLMASHAPPPVVDATSTPPPAPLGFADNAPSQADRERPARRAGLGALARRGTAAPVAADTGRDGPVPVDAGRLRGFGTEEGGQ